MTEAEREARERQRGEALARLETKVERLISDVEDLSGKVDVALKTVAAHEQRLSAISRMLWMIAGALVTAVVGSLWLFVISGKLPAPPGG